MGSQRLLMTVGISLLENASNVCRGIYERKEDPLSTVDVKAFKETYGHELKDLVRYLQHNHPESAAETESFEAIRRRYKVSSLALLPTYTVGSYAAALALREFLSEKLGIVADVMPPPEGFLAENKLEGERGLRSAFADLAKRLAEGSFEFVNLTGGYKGHLLFLVQLVNFMKAMGFWPGVKVFYKYKGAKDTLEIPLFGELDRDRMACRILKDIQEGREEGFLFDALVSVVWGAGYRLIWISKEAKKDTEKLDKEQLKRFYQVLEEVFSNPTHFRKHKGSGHKVYGRGKEPVRIVAEALNPPPGVLSEPPQKARVKLLVYRVFPISEHDGDYRRVDKKEAYRPEKVEKMPYLYNQKEARHVPNC